MKMDKTLAWLRRPIVKGMIGLILVSILLLVLLPLVTIDGSAPFENMFAVATLVLLLWLLVIVYLIWMDYKLRQKGQRLIDMMMGEGIPENLREAVGDEQEAIQNKFKSAMASLRGSQRKYNVYQLPWYIIVGPPGTGKTTALTHSGLRFPLNEADGSADSYLIDGVGGTRNCDWWFADDAVMIDTAGRFFSQDSQETVDSEGWNLFLNLLRKHRPKQPVNGILLTLSVESLISAESAELEQYQKLVRQRLLELSEALGANIPVYLLFTKLDLVAGFSESFGRLDQAAREQVWGVTLANRDGAERQSWLSEFQEQWKKLMARLGAGVFSRCVGLAEPRDRGLALDFPRQLQQAAPVLDGFLQYVFKPTRYFEQPWIRGIYLSSATQSGSPVDRLMVSTAGTLGLTEGQQRAFSGKPKSFFLTRLLKDVIFAESGISATSQQGIRRSWRAKLIGYGATAVVTAICIVTLFSAYFSNRETVQQADLHLRDIETKLTRLTVDPQAQPVANILSQSEELAIRKDSGWGWMVGLDQGYKLSQAGSHMYHQILRQLLQPWLLKASSQKFDAEKMDASELYTLLKLYLNLATGQYWRSDFVDYAFATTELPGEALELHAKHLAHIDPATLGQLADQQVIAKARKALSGLELPLRLYLQLRNSRYFNELPSVGIHSVVTAPDQLLFQETGRGAAPIPGMFTPQGFMAFASIATADFEEVLEQDRWVLGIEEPAEFDIAPVLPELQTLYIDDYASEWHRFLGEISLADVEDSKGMVALLTRFTSPESPLVRITRSGINGTLFDPSAEEFESVSESDSLADMFSEQRVKLSEQFHSLHQLNETRALDSEVTSESLRLVLEELAKLRSFWAKADEQLSGGKVVEATDLHDSLKRWNQQLRELADAQPEPVSSLLLELNYSAGRMLAAELKQSTEEPHKQLDQVCQQVTTGKYPFRNSLKEVRVEEFNRLFATNGAFDQFSSVHLTPWVVKSDMGWQWNQMVAGLDDDWLKPFSRAQKLSRYFYPNNATQPNVVFTVSERDKKPSKSRQLLEINGQKLQSDAHKNSSTTMSWPKTGNAGYARVELNIGEIELEPVNESGTWSMFRMMEKQRTRRLGNGRYLMSLSGSFRNMKYLSVYEIYEGSSSNKQAFMLDLLRDFQCPTQL